VERIVRAAVFLLLTALNISGVKLALSSGAVPPQGASDLGDLGDLQGVVKILKFTRGAGQNTKTYFVGAWQPET
jgi:hypothetical protein